MGAILSRGEALSLWAWSGSAGTQTIFEDNNFGNRAIKLQGFTWGGSAVCTVKDFRGAVVFSRGVTTPGIWPATASGSYGLITTVPLTVEVATSPAGGGGILVVYGEVM